MAATSVRGVLIPEDEKNAISCSPDPTISAPHATDTSYHSQQQSLVRTRNDTPEPSPIRKPRETLAVGGIPCVPNLWAIHGKYYDLASFVSQHPGGVEMITLGRGRDCTEMFESIHALSKRGVHKMLEKYEVPTPEGAPPPPEDTFSWAEDGFYSTVKKRVRSYFDETRQSHKATPLYWLKMTTLFCLWSFFIYHALFATTRAVSILSAVVAGFLMNMMGFCGMHDGSHYGISKRPWVNKVVHTLWSDWNLWSHFIWLRHHVYGHHSYTAIYRRDPDIVNIMPLVRKSPRTRPNKTHKFQPFSAVMLLTVFPNQHVGQSLLYLVGFLRRKLFSTVPIEDFPSHVLKTSICIYIPSLIFHFVVPFLLLDTWTAYFMIVAYWTAQGVGYFVNIAPNHDTLDTHNSLEEVAAKEQKGSDKTMVGGKRDWGVQQVIGSGNHTTDKGLMSLMVTQLWGGMNYQIEHHLFPAVSHMHYAGISSIVEKTCEEFEIPYVRHSWLQAVLRFGNLVCLLAAPISHVKQE